ncbi:MAG: DUF1501 domain-containing protein [Planctomycetes bacterium]|nr:DUF1501 domain-containing protein [Planctomycetota bacterium]MCB9916823.1 DUF1501 domain-containing protein [Planctomycetota bacterium]
MFDHVSQSIGAPLSRRALLARGSAIGAGLLVRPSTSWPALLGDEGKILVVVQLSGGNDGLNTVVPINDPEYAKRRGRLAIARKEAIDIGNGRALHPSMSGLATLFRKNRLAIVEGCGYPSPNRSHFKSMDIWHAGDPSATDLRYGWLGRALDACDDPAPDLAVNVSPRSPLALQGEHYKPISFRDPSAYRYVATKRVSNAFEKVADVAERDANPVLAAVRRTADEALGTSRRIRELALAYDTPQDYPRQAFGSSLRSIAGLIAGGLKSRVYYTYLGSFDTHAGQLQRHANLLTQLDQGLAAFSSDLERLGLADRVCVVAFSEFGRRVAPNASGGTDHGVAGPMFVVGSRVKGGLYGRHPSLVDLDKGDLVHTTDFRRVYATLLDDWMGADSRTVLGAPFESLRFVS